MAHRLWPLYDLRLGTSDLELRLPTEDELVPLCRVARAGVHDPAWMPFTVPWTDEPSPRFEREFLKYHWRLRSQWSPEQWTLGLAVFRGDEPIGFQDIAADEYRLLREVRTGSWLGLAFQGHGYGKQMRAAVLHLAFAGLDAVAAYSGAFADNPASLAVSRALGYEPNGLGRKVSRGQPRDHLGLRLTRERWQAMRYCEVEMAGLGTCRDMFGA